MTTFQGSTFSDSTINVDGNVYEHCEFIDCELVYSGGDLPSFSYCGFLGTSHFLFDGAADRTLAVLKAMADPNSGMQHLIRNTFRELGMN